MSGATRVNGGEFAGPQPLGGRVDDDTVSRFATCCKALGLSVYDRRRPADLPAARTGFGALTRIADDQCDAWAGLAAAGDTSPQVLEALSVTAATAGVLQRRIPLAPGALGFDYDTGLYLAFIPFVCVIRGRIWPWFQVLTITLLPITLLTVEELVSKVEGASPLLGLFFYLVVPLLIATTLASYYTWLWFERRNTGAFVTIALLANTWLYFCLNYAFFHFPWPWAEWTGRTPNGIVFTIFAFGLTAMVFFSWKRIRTREAESV